MPTLTSHGKDQIAFRTTGEERAFGLLHVGVGAIFVDGPLREFIENGTRAFLAAITLIFIIGIAEIVYGLFVVFQSKWLVIDLNHGTYSGRRRLLLRGETLSGPLEDFDHLRLWEVPCGRHGRQRKRVVDWVWCEEAHRPFRISTRKRLGSVHLTRLRSAHDTLDLFVTFQAVSRDTGVPLIILPATDTGAPLIVPEKYLDSLGVFDPELDGVSTARAPRPAGKSPGLADGLPVIPHQRLNDEP